jgi:hypothetical protein
MTPCPGGHPSHLGGVRMALTEKGFSYFLPVGLRRTSRWMYVVGPLPHSLSSSSPPLRCARNPAFASAAPSRTLLLNHISNITLPIELCYA